MGHHGSGPNDLLSPWSAADLIQDAPDRNTVQSGVKVRDRK